MDAITVSELARRHGVSRQRAYQWIVATPGLRPELVRWAGIIALSPAHVRRILERPRRRTGRPRGSRNRPTIARHGTESSPDPK